MGATAVLARYNSSQLVYEGTTTTEVPIGVKTMNTSIRYILHRLSSVLSILYNMMYQRLHAWKRLSMENTPAPTASTTGVLEIKWISHHSQLRCRHTFRRSNRLFLRCRFHRCHILARRIIRPSGRAADVATHIEVSWTWNAHAYMPSSIYAKAHLHIRRKPDQNTCRKLQIYEHFAWTRHPLPPVRTKFRLL